MIDKHTHKQHSIRRSGLALLALVCAFAASPPGSAQELSYDGNRWYEVEIIAFTNAPLGPNRETLLPEKTDLGYLPRLLELASPSASLHADFAPPPTATGAPAFANAAADAPPAFPAAAEEPAPAPELGPSPLARAATPFRLSDLSRDPFIALPTRQHRLTDVARRLDNSADHRVLYHATWRQPGLSRAQARAVFVHGGDRFGDHQELEGSVLLTDFGTGINVELYLWLSRFRAASPGERLEPGWTLPAQPFTQDATSTVSPIAPRFPGVAPSTRSRFPSAAFTPAPPRYVVDDLTRLRQDRNVATGTLHYFDNPALGVIVEVRSYVLPLPAALSQE